MAPVGAEGERLEHPSAVVHQVSPRTHVGLVELRPRLPRRHGVVEPCADLGLAPDPGRARVGPLGCDAGRSRRSRRWRSWSWPETADWSTVRATGEERTSTSAPPNAVTPPSTASSRGWTSPYSGRGTYSRDSSTSPSTQVARRSRRCGASLPSSCPRLPSPMARASVIGDRARRRAEGGLQHHGAVQVAAGHFVWRSWPGSTSGRLRHRGGDRRSTGCRSVGSTTSRSTRPGSPAPRCADPKGAHSRLWGSCSCELLRPYIRGIGIWPAPVKPSALSSRGFPNAYRVSAGSRLIPTRWGLPPVRRTSELCDVSFPDRVRRSADR